MTEGSGARRLAGGALMHAGLLGAHRGEAVPGPGRDRSGAAWARRHQFPTVRVIEVIFELVFIARLLEVAAEDVLAEVAPPGAQAACG